MTACIVVAAGRGERLEAGRPKALVELAGRPILDWCLTGIRAAGLDEVVVVGPPQDLEPTRRVVTAQRPDAVVVPGGATRQQSVRAGLAALSGAADLVLVHDAARCLTPVEVFDRVVAALRAGAAAVVPARPVVDTIRARSGGVVDRSTLVAVQTPQGFRRDLLERAHAAADPAATDDAVLVEDLGETVTLVDGHEEALKVTTPFDLRIAHAILTGTGRA